MTAFAFSPTREPLRPWSPPFSNAADIRGNLAKRLVSNLSCTNQQTIDRQRLRPHRVPYQTMHGFPFRECSHLPPSHSRWACPAATAPVLRTPPTPPAVTRPTSPPRKRKARVQPARC